MILLCFLYKSILVSGVWIVSLKQGSHNFEIETKKLIDIGIKKSWVCVRTSIEKKAWYCTGAAWLWVVITFVLVRREVAHHLGRFRSESLNPLAWSCAYPALVWACMVLCTPSSSVSMHKAILTWPSFPRCHPVIGIWHHDNWIISLKVNRRAKIFKKGPGATRMKVEWGE